MEREPLIASRLLEYEMWTRLNARNEIARQLLAPASPVSLVELASPVLLRALQPFPLPVRTLDALHLATLDFLRERGLKVRLANYDDKLNEVAHALGFVIAPMELARRQ